MTRKERILARLSELGAEPKRSLGQNFLISDHVVERILFAAKSRDSTDLVEVGPGLGALTEDLLSLGKPLVLIELDRRFAEYWRSREGVQLIEADALQLDWSNLGLKEDSLFISNLPYQISSSIVVERSLNPAGISRMILMFQKEVAQRIAARESSAEYGLLTVIAQTFWEIQTVCDAGPKDFYPPPNVASRVLMFRRGPEVRWESGASASGFLKFAKTAFSHRRKLLKSNLQGSFNNVEAALAELGLLATSRAEELDPPTFVRLYQKLVVTRNG